MNDFGLNNELIYLFRIIIAGMCGLIIGIERKNRSKEAGVRTHFVVACAAALMMIVSKYAFLDIIKIYGIAFSKLDPSRIASQIVSGVGFLGAGMIFVHKRNVQGLTTAAGIWATAGVGMAIGAGMYFVGILSSFVILFAQIILHINFSWNRKNSYKKLIIEKVSEDNFKEKISNLLKEQSIYISEIEIEKLSDGTKNYQFIIESEDDIDDEAVISLVQYKTIIKNA